MIEALRRLWPLIERSTKGYVFTAERAGEVTADMNTLRAALAAQPADAARGGVPDQINKAAGDLIAIVLDQCSGYTHGPGFEAAQKARYLRTSLMLHSAGLLADAPARAESAAEPPSPYYIAGPFAADGEFAVCETATGRIIRKFRGPDDILLAAGTQRVQAPAFGIDVLVTASAEPVPSTCGLTECRGKAQCGTCAAMASKPAALELAEATKALSRLAGGVRLGHAQDTALLADRMQEIAEKFTKVLGRL